MSEKFLSETSPSISRFAEAQQDPISTFFVLLKKKNTVDVDAIEPADIDISYLSPEQRAESLWALYQEARRARRKKNSKHLEGTLSLLKAFTNDSETADTFREHYDRHQFEVESINGAHEQYSAARRAVDTRTDALDATARDIFSHRDEGMNEMRVLQYEATLKAAVGARSVLEDILSENPQIAAQAHAETLARYGKEFEGEKFIWSPSRRRALELVERAALSGKPILLSGESGTGKTRIMEQIAYILTGEAPAETPGKDIRFQDLIAKPKIAPGGGTYYEYKEIGAAFTGKDSTQDEAPTHDGRLVTDDEFNLLDESEQNTRLSRVAAWTPGKKVRMPVTNITETIAPNALYAAMVNLASARYKRNRIPPEVLRKFAKADLDYPPQTPDDPELFDMLLGPLHDENGRFRVSREAIAPAYAYEERTEDVVREGQSMREKVRIRHLDEDPTHGGFLWRFANALRECNESFAHRETVLHSRGQAQYMKDMVIDMGTVTGWLSEYRTLGRTTRMATFLCQKLEEEFLTKEAYTIDDRALVRAFFSHVGIDIEKEAADTTTSPKPFTVLTPQEVGLLSPRVPMREILSREPVVRESYYMTDAGERVEYWIRAHMGIEPDAIISNGAMWYRYKGVEKVSGELVLEETSEPITIDEEKERGTHEQITFDRAKEIMGEEKFFGPDALAATFDVALSAHDIPPIPFPEQELVEARERGEMLVLRHDRAKDGTPLTMKKMSAIVQPKLQAANKGKTLYNKDWYTGEPFFTTETPRAGWALVTQECIPGSNNKNYLHQTEQLLDHIRDGMFRDRELPQPYKEAIDAFTAWKQLNFSGKTKKQMTALLRGPEKARYAQELVDLQISQLLRPSAAETFFDIMTVVNATHDTRMLEQMYAWTSTRSSAGRLVNLGYAVADGVFVNGDDPAFAFEALGSLLSRRG
jgi:hypothetical protein